MICQGQSNLVPNPSFEETVHCPTIQSGDVSQAVGWKNPTLAGSVYYNECASPSGDFEVHGVPWNQYAYQYAHDGNAYVMIATFAIGGNGNLRYYVEAQLEDTLDAGREYLVQFYVSLGDSSAWGCDDIGAYFSDTMVYDYATQGVLPYLPQVQNSAGNSLNNKTGWNLFSQVFTATGGENWMTIGNFIPDAYTNFYSSQNGAPWSSGADMLIDDISVTQLFHEGVDAKMPGNIVRVFPNPTSNSINVQIDATYPLGTSVELCSNDGRSIIAQKKFDATNFSFNLSAFPSGIYLLKVQNQNFVLTQKIVKL